VLAEPLSRRIKTSSHGLDSVKTDVRSCGLLVVDVSKSGAFRFAHKSFMEYLAAEVLASVALDRISLRNAIEAPHECKAATAIAVATRLDFGHLSLYPESLVFFAELFMSKLMVAERKKTEAAGLRCFDRTKGASIHDGPTAKEHEASHGQAVLLVETERTWIVCRVLKQRCEEPIRISALMRPARAVPQSRNMHGYGTE